jgi:hypothetical protein
MKTLTSFLSLLFIGAANAATLTGTHVAFPGGVPPTVPVAVLPAGANTDWGYFNSGADVVASINASNTSDLTGTRTFTVTPAGTATNVRGSTTLGDTRFSYTNGTDPISSGTQRVGGVFSSTTGPSGEGSGVQLTVSSFSGTSLIELYTYEFRASGTLSVFLNGGADPAYTQVITTGSDDGTKDGYKFSFTFTADSLTDTLRFQYIMDDAVGDNGSSNLGFQAIAISPIPEPTPLLLLSLSGLPLAMRRRR